MWAGTETSACIEATTNFSVIQAFPSPTPTITPTKTLTPTPTKTLTPTPTPVNVVYTSQAVNDGWIVESATPGVGGTMDNTSVNVRLGDNAANHQYRTILSFNTAPLPDTATVQSAVIKIKQNGPPANTNPFTILGLVRVDICNPAFGTASLQLTDFGAGAVAPTVCVISVSNFDSTPVSAWYSAILPLSGRQNINLDGITQFRLRFATNNNNNGIADYMNFFSSDNATDQPQLIITYTLP